ncbi:MAG: hypothetical protein IKD46_07475 [Lentisphaeria bacterium]|nr:hypothetical protein [Lentisphaeria bacterium]
MIEDIYEPLARYREEFREKFAENTKAEFQKLLKQAQIDTEANRLLNQKIKSVQEESARCKDKNAMMGCFLFLLITGILAGAAAILYGFWGDIPSAEKLKFAGGGLLWSTVSFLLIFLWLRPKQKQLEAKIAALKKLQEDLTREAWEQMAPLNELFHWHITANLIRKTVPRLEFDPYFSEGRLLDLHHSFGWDDSFNHGRSVISSHSGVINDNPFVFGELKNMEWGEETYTGTKEIHWTTREKGPDGKTRTVHHHQTLVATYTAPKPVYFKEKFLIYGNDAAPDLHFSRQPSDLSGLEDGFFNNWRKKRELNALKDLSRNLEDDLPYTLMSNHDFEILFHATDRNDDVAFRLLFTPLAQQQMVRLLNDTEVGYGDDFCFTKSGKINLLLSCHLNETNLDTDPEQFKFCNVDEAEAFFRKFNEDFFRSVYFALAPLLTIPLYQQTRTAASIYNRKTHFKSCFWEHEAIANYYGDEYFKHPDCITENILKTSCKHQLDGSTKVEVTAHGYRGKERIAYVEKWGGDGNLHDVPVPWTEYLPVRKKTTFHAVEDVMNYTITYARDVIARRSVYAFFQ